MGVRATGLGTRGATGETGSSGANGAPGATGPAGPTGPTGPAGTTGAAGATGPAGSNATATPLGSATPQPLGTAAAGSSANASREDHVHALPASNNALIGTVNVTETATIAITAGVRKVTVTVSGVATGGNYLLFPISATPAGYALADVVATAANTLQVSLTAPLLAVGASYSIPCRCVRINT